MKKYYLTLIVLLFFNFVFQGFAAIIISQNMEIFMDQWSASISQVSLVVSAIGLGRILSLNLAGYVSDRFGRKGTVILGIFAYIIFFIGLLLSKNYFVGIVIALFAGVGNAFLDTSAYPVVLEAFPTGSMSNSLSVLNKAFISTGQFILPIITRFIHSNDIYYGWPFIISAVILAANIAVTSTMKFPPRIDDEPINKTSSNEVDIIDMHPLMKKYKPKFKIEGFALIVFSFVSVSLFNIFILWIPQFAEKYAQLSAEDSLIFVSVYSLASFISVFATFSLVKKGIDIPKFILMCLVITIVGVMGMIIIPSMVAITIASVIVGVFAAGGIWQLGLSIILEYFPKRKGIITSHYSLSTAISVMITPYFTGVMAEHNIIYNYIYLVVLAVVGCLCMGVIIYRQEQSKKLSLS